MKREQVRYAIGRSLPTCQCSKYDVGSLLSAIELSLEEGRIADGYHAMRFPKSTVNNNPAYLLMLASHWLDRFYKSRSYPGLPFSPCRVSTPYFMKLAKTPRTIYPKIRSDY